jgi:hypothetical protein
MSQAARFDTDFALSFDKLRTPLSMLGWSSFARLAKAPRLGTGPEALQ